MVYRAQERPKGLLEKVTDVPLPGHYQCLVMQSNVTLYPPTMLVRSVHVWRDPGSGVELGRLIQESEPWSIGRDNAVGRVIRMLSDCDYLSGGLGLRTP